MRVESRVGGCMSPLGGRPFPEEYPTQPPSFVLNGGIFALWGLRDVAVALGDEQAARDFAAGAETLAQNLDRWDTGRWSRYDLFPHPVANPASSFYHDLHVKQLRAMALLHPDVRFTDRAEPLGALRRLRAATVASHSRARGCSASSYRATACSRTGCHGLGGWPADRLSGAGRPLSSFDARTCATGPRSR